MDKKKVKELIEEVINSNIDSLEFGCDKHNAPLRKANSLLHDALIELGKSDWVSVEDGLPPCEEEVLVRDINAKGNWSKPWICYRSKNECYRHITDKHKFVTTRLGEITHWRPIDKLEE